MNRQDFTISKKKKKEKKRKERKQKKSQLCLVFLTYLVIYGIFISFFYINSESSADGSMVRVSMFTLAAPCLATFRFHVIPK